MYKCSVSYIWVKAGIKLWSERFLLFYFMVTKLYDNTRGLRIKQSDGKYVIFPYAKTSFIMQKKKKNSLL